MWKTFAKLRNEDYEQLPIILEDVQFHRATIMPKEGSVKFLINIFDGSGEFEICEGGSVAVSGKIYSPDDISKEILDLPKPKEVSGSDILPLSSSDIYKELRLRGYDYDGIFRGIASSDNYAHSGQLKWEKNWISFIDTMLQFSILGQNTRELYLPTRLHKLIINPKHHIQFVKKDQIPVHMYREIGIIKSGGIELRGMKASLAPRRQQVQSAPKLEKYQFVPFKMTNPLCEDEIASKKHTMTVLTQLILENSSGALKLKIAEVPSDTKVENLMSPTIQEIVEKEPMLSVDVTVVSQINLDTSTLEQTGIKFVLKDVTSNLVEQNCHLVILSNAFTHKKEDILQNAIDSLKVGGFVLVEEYDKNLAESQLNKFNLDVISQMTVNNKLYILLRKPEDVPSDAIVITITENHFKWVEPLKDAMKKSEMDNTKIYLVTQGEELTGLIGMMNCIKQEPGGGNVRSVFLQDSKADQFSLTSTNFTNQLRKDLVQNVYKNGVWGSYRHLSLDQMDGSGKLQVEHAYINALTRGDLSSLKWIEGPLTYYKYVFFFCFSRLRDLYNFFVFLAFYTTSFFL